MPQEHDIMHRSIRTLVTTLIALASIPIVHATPTDLLGPSALAPPQESCSVSADGPTQCRFSCVKGKPITLSLAVTEGELGATASCGGQSIKCITRSGTCRKTAEATGNQTTGLCELNHLTYEEDSGSASCTGALPERNTGTGSDPDCRIKIDPILCIEDPASGVPKPDAAEAPSSCTHFSQTAWGVPDTTLPLPIEGWAELDDILRPLIAVEKPCG